ncbi:hypothetical protein J5U18_12720 [Sphingobacteriaceae bacterium WQ 2009]|uniref:Uncharacterized protein n=1 Tax=Rhinopithecimicrobium faecis TaxID=2820698 RepID=A0A8T4HC93_9SPHI|nr:hypothetical protein [Sphingobacteriaceae bacterium WQ 2009]
MKQLITDATKSELIFEIDKLYNYSSKDLDIINSKLQKLNITEETCSRYDLKLDFIAIKNILEYRMFLGIVNLDLHTVTLLYLKSNYNYEKIYATRQIVVIIYESFKKIYDFEVNLKGAPNRNRKKSFWVKIIKPLIIKEFPNFLDEYLQINKELDAIHLKLNNEHLIRSLSVHYDHKIIKVYNMIINMDIEGKFKNLIEFQKILSNMSKFISKIEDKMINN